jgi:hypothetical protein
MPTTTNNGWPTPADTDLVKNGADAIRDLGQAIDTTLGVYSPSTPGLVKINTTSFSAVSSVSLPAATFTSTYTNYRIIFNVTSVSTSSSVQLRLRASGTDDTSANYDTQNIIGSMGTPSANGSNNDTSFGISSAARDTAHNFVLDIINPQATANTFIAGTYFNTDAGANMQGGVTNGRFQLTTSFDSATFIC